MKGMILHKPGRPLVFEELPDPIPGSGELRVRVEACGVGRTDLHVVDGELPNPKLPIIPGHEIVGRIDALGPHVDGLDIGARVGIPWLGSTCGYCVSHRENLCDQPGLYRLHTKRRLRNPRNRRRALCFSFERRRHRRRACAFALCRSHRLALA